VAYLVELEGFDDRDDELHGLRPWFPLRVQPVCAAGGPCQSGLDSGRWHKKAAALSKKARDHWLGH
jgi:hypothetical protein